VTGGFVHKDGDFTLLEVMIALAVLAGVVVTVLSTLNYHLGVASRSSDLVTASILGRTKTEEVALFGLPTPGEGVFGEEAGVGAGTAGVRGVGGLERFRWKVTAEKTEIEGLTRVGVRVFWDDDREVSFTSFRR